MVAITEIPTRRFSPRQLSYADNRPQNHVGQP